MALMVGSLYDALKSAGVEDDKAKKAAEEVASYDNRVGRVESELLVIKWMIGFNLAMSTAILFRVFS